MSEQAQFTWRNNRTQDRLRAHADQRLNQRSGGFTMTELLVTMILLTITLTGLTALQLTTIRRVTATQRSADALRLAETVISRYEEESAPFLQHLPEALPTPGWEIVNYPDDDGTREMRNVALDGQSDGPFTVERLVENLGSQRIITVRVSWRDVNAAAAGNLNLIRGVTLSMQRSQ